MTFDFASVMELVRTGGTLAVLLALIYGGLTRRVVFGWQYDAVVKDRDDWKKLALSATSLGEKAVGHR